jgi:hypothetical protein
VNRCRVTATDDVPILAAQAYCHTCASGRSRSVIKSEITPAHKPADLHAERSMTGSPAPSADLDDRRDCQRSITPMSVWLELATWPFESWRLR